MQNHLTWEDNNASEQRRRLALPFIISGQENFIEVLATGENLYYFQVEILLQKTNVIEFTYKEKNAKCTN